MPFKKENVYGAAAGQTLEGWSVEITEVRIKLMDDADDRLQAFCSVTFDNCFVVRDLKIIDGTNGPFVAMPSRKLTAHCHLCGSKNHLRALYCNQCGGRQRDDLAVKDAEGRAKLYADIAHPINSACREQIQNRVIAEFLAERERAKLPGYASRYEEQYPDAETSSWKPAGESQRGGDAPASPIAAAPSESGTPIAGLPEGSRVEPAEPSLRPPHTPAAKPPDSGEKKPPERKGFGKGIFEE